MTAPPADISPPVPLSETPGDASALNIGARWQRWPAPVRRPLGYVRRQMGRFVPDDVWTNWKWDLLAGVSSGVYQGCVWTFALQLARGTLKATGFEMGLATAAPAIGYLFATFWARQMEGRSKLPFVTLTWIISRGLFLLTPLLVRGAVSREALVTLICITPILFSVSTPAYTAIMKEIYPDALRGRLMSYVRLGMAGAMLLTARIMGVWQEQGHLDFRWMFAIGGAFGVGTALAFGRLRLPPVMVVGSPPPLGQFLRQTFGILRYNRGYRWFTTSVFIAGFGNLVASTLYPICQVDRFHVSPTQIANLQNIAGVLSLISLFFWGSYMDRRGSLAAVLAATLIMSLAPLFYAVAPRIEWLYLASAANGFSQMGIDLGYLNTTLMFAEPGRAAHYQAVHSSFFGLRGTIAPLLAVPIFHAVHSDWRIAFAICLVIMGVGCLFQLLSLASYRRIQAESNRAVVGS